jgi:hypothetical protein
MMSLPDAVMFAERWRERWPSDAPSSRAFATLLEEKVRAATQEQADARTIADLTAEVGRYEAMVAEYERTRTTGGPALQVGWTWANRQLPPPDTAADETAPPLHSERSSRHRFAS